jgi:dipeptidyl aminopeptidase/acylaminoacyl peptidase
MKEKSVSTPKKLLAALLAGVSTASVLSGCPGVTTVLAVNLENPNLRVSEETTLRLEVLAAWFRTPVFYYRARRGRIVGMNGESNARGQFVRATNVVKYYAPYTSTYPSPEGGLSQNDEIEIRAQDGAYIATVTKSVQINGSSVVFSSVAEGGQNGTLQIARDSGAGQLSTPEPMRDLAGTPLRGNSPAIAPNGERIAYVSYPGDGTAKIMMRDASGQVLALTNYPRGLCLDPAWSPDGNYLLFASTHETTDGTFEIYMMNVDQSQGGLAVTRLTNNSWDDRHPAWNPVLSAPEDRIIAVTSRKNNLTSPGGRANNWNVFLMSRNGAYTREISAVQGDGDNWAVEPSWRPDGNAIAYTRFGPVNNYQSGASKFQRIFVQELQQSPTLVPLNISNTDPNSRESSPVWATDRTNDIMFLRTDGNFQSAARVFRTTYQPGSTGNTFLPQVIAPFQGLNLPLTVVSGTNREISGFHTYDWR